MTNRKEEKTKTITPKNAAKDPLITEILNELSKLDESECDKTLKRWLESEEH